MFDVLQEHGIAQPTPDGNAIWQATVTSDTGWTQPFTFLRLSPALIWDTGDRPRPFSRTVRLDSGHMAASGNDVADRSLAPSALDSPAPPMIDKGQHGTDATSNPVSEILGLLDGASEDAAPPAAEPTTSATDASRLSKRSGDGHDSVGNADYADATTEDRQGERFMQWLRDGIRSHRLIINDAKALVHTVAGTAFLVRGRE